MDGPYERLRNEFIEMPGLRLTASQAYRLCGIEADACETALTALVDAKFLCRKDDGTYMRLTEGRIPRPEVMA
jgi:hypothetical protein